jgi:hypothetical protein
MRTRQVEVHLGVSAHQTGVHGRDIERLAGLGCGPGVAELERCRDGVDGHVDRAERGAHVVRLARVVGDAAGGGQQRLCRAPVEAGGCRRGGGQMEGTVDAESFGRE